MASHRFYSWILVAAGGGLFVSLPAQAGPPAASATYRVRHSLSVKDLPEGSKKVRIWFWVPDDDDAQKVLDLKVLSAPDSLRVTRDANNGHQYLYAEVEEPKEAITLSTEFLFRRNAVAIELDPAKAGELTDTHRKLFADHMRKDCPHMEVSDTLVKLANKICGEETNVVKQAKLLYDYLVENTNHYSKKDAPRSSGLGSAAYCLDSKGGGCTDQHAAFIAMARARGIPTRLHFGSRLTAQNEGKVFDPGYRCWVTYFVPNYGWVPMDISAGNTNPKEKDRFSSGLDERRVHFHDGRDLVLTPKQDGPRVNLFITAYIEVDGKPHKKFERQVKFEEIKGEKSALKP